jgi:ADP-heptose:LPS heptosyltransferase
VKAFAPDVIIDFEPWARISAVICVLAGRFTLGFNCPEQNKHFAFDRAVRHSSKCHEIDNYRRLAAALGVRSRQVPQLTPRDRDLGAGERMNGRPFVLLHPWPGGFMGQLREWPTASWAEISRRAMARGYDVLISGSSADATRSEQLAEQIASPPRCRSIAGRHSLVQMVSVLSEASVIISVNTGIMHLAAAIARPLIALNGPTNPRRWGALGVHARNINAELPGCGFLNLGFEIAGNRCDCMESIQIERVWKELETLLPPT